MIVAIFGGSVGGGFALTAAENAEFVAAVTRHPRFAGRRVRVLNFANSGYHQPQQLLVFSYYLALGQHFDLVINIDGFNEVVIAENNWRAGADPTFPAVQVWHAMGQELESRNPAHTDEAYFEAQWHKRASARLAIRADRCGLASCYLWYRGRGAYHDYRLARAERRVIANNGRPTLFPMGRSWGTGDDPRHRDILAFAADGWMRASRTMDRMARDHGALYLHVLQPNQWHSTGRPYQPITVDHPYKAVIPLVEQGYPLLIRRASDLARQGIHVVDATGAFAGRADRDMFIDDCCHYTDEGYRILYGAVGDALAAVR